MAQIPILIQCFGECIKKDGDEWECVAVDECNLTVDGVFQSICDLLSINRYEYEIILSYIPKYEIGNAYPIYVRNQLALKSYLSFGDSSNRPLLRVEFVKKIQSFENENYFVNDAKAGEVQDENNIIVPDKYFDSVYIEKNVVDASSTAIVKKTEKDELRKDDVLKDDLHKHDVSKEDVQKDDLSNDFWLNCDGLNHNGSKDDELNMMSLGCSSNGTYSFTDRANLSVGQEFLNKNDVKVELSNIAERASFEMCVSKSTKTVYAVRCMDSNCTWRVRAAQIKNSTYFSIRTYCNKHTCNLVRQKRRHRQASSLIVADMLMDNFREQEVTPPSIKTIMTMMQNKDIEISYHKAWRAKQIVLKRLKGDQD